MKKEPRYCQIQGPRCKDIATSIIDKGAYHRVIVCASCWKLVPLTG